MAESGAGRPCVKCYLAFALIAVVILAATGVWNPFPGVWSWVNRSEPLSEPDVLWQQRLGGTPRSVTIAGDAVIVRHRTTVEARSLATGIQLWQRKADWAAVAGGASRDSVVAAGKLLDKGYEVIDPRTGAVRRRDAGAVGVWTYRNALLDVRCDDPKECTLAARDPRGSTPVWTGFLPGVSTGLTAGNPEVLGTRPLTTERVHADAAGPPLTPSLLGFPVDGRVHVVDTSTGRVVQDLEPATDERLVVVGGRVLRIRARSQDGTCYFTVTASEPVSGQQVWQRTGINLRTADGAGCPQRKDPQGGQNVIIGVGPDGREAVLDAYDGRLLWVGEDGEKLLAVDDRTALARSGDGETMRARGLGVEQRRWARPIHPEGGAALTPYAVIVVDRKPDRIIALDPATGRELVNLRSSAEVLAVGPAGMVIGDGRDVGYVRFGAGVGPAGGQDDGVPRAPAPGSGDGDGDGPGCGGTGQQPCPDGDDSGK